MEQNVTTRAEDGGDRSVRPRWCEGCTLLDPLGQTLERVERVFCNRAGEPQDVRVWASLFARRLMLIPVMDVAVDDGHRTITLR